MRLSSRGTAPAVLVSIALMWLAVGVPATAAPAPASRAAASHDVDSDQEQAVSAGGTNLGEYAFNGTIRSEAVDPSTGITYVGGDFTQVGIRTGEVAAIDPPDSGSDHLAGASPGVLGSYISAFEDDATGYFLAGNVTSVQGDGIHRLGTIRMTADGNVDTSWSVSGPCANEVNLPRWDLGDSLVAPVGLSSDGSGLSTVGLAFIDKASGQETIVGGGTDPCAGSTRIWPSVAPFPPFAECQDWLTCDGYVDDVVLDQKAHVMVAQTLVVSQETASSDQRLRAFLVGYDMDAGTRIWWTELQTPIGSPPSWYQGRETRMVGLGGAILASGYFPLEVDRSTASTMLLLDETTGTILQRWSPAGEQDPVVPANRIALPTDCTPADSGWNDYLNWSFARLGPSSAIGYGGGWSQYPGYRSVQVCQFGLSGSSAEARLSVDELGALDALPDSGFIYGLPSTLYAERYLVGGFGAFDLQTDTQVTSWNPSPSTAPKSVIVVGSTVVMAGSGGGDDFAFVHGRPASHVAALDSDLAPISAFDAQLPDTSRSAAGIQNVWALRIDGDELLVAGDLKGPFGRGPVVALDTGTGALKWAHAESELAVGIALTVDPANGSFYLGAGPSEASAVLTRYVRTPGGFSLDSSFDHPVGPYGEYSSAYVTGLAFLDGRLYIGGLFGSVDGQPREGIARLGVDGSLDSWAPALTDELGAPAGAGIELQPRAFLESNGSVVVSGTFDWWPSGGGQVTSLSSILVYDAGTAALVRPVGTDDSWKLSVGASGGFDMVTDGGAIYVAMGYLGIKAFDPNTFDYLPDRSFETAFNGVDAVYALVVQAEPATSQATVAVSQPQPTLVIGGFLPRWGNQPAGNVAALTPDSVSTPGAPTNVHGNPGSGKVTVGWSAPSSSGGSAITRYTATSSPGSKTCTWSSGPLSCTVSGLSNGQPYTFTVTAHNAAGDGPPSSASASVTPIGGDSTPPSVSAPSGYLVSSSSLSLTTTAQVHLSWTPATDASGIASYRLQKRKGTGSWTTVTLGSPTATSVNLNLAPASYTFRLRATDASANHNVSGWVTTSAHKLSLVQENSSTIHYSTGWTRKKLSGSSASYVKFASTTGAKANYTFSGSSIAFVTTTGPGYGLAQIFIDGVQQGGSLDLYSATTHKKLIAWSPATPLTPGSHTLELRVLGTKDSHASATRIDLDALLVWN